jgi:hypothetical protein
MASGASSKPRGEQQRHWRSCGRRHDAQFSCGADPGHAYRLNRHVLLQEFKRAGLLQLAALHPALSHADGADRRLQRLSSVEKQLCRWLLQTLDRQPSNELVMTQELVASMLGVRREGITEAAGNLQRAGCISYRRGHISVLDRSGLEARACECYAVVRKELGRLLSDIRYRQEMAADDA